LPAELRAIGEPVPVVEDRLLVQRSTLRDHPQIGRRQMSRNNSQRRVKSDDRETVGGSMRVPGAIMTLIRTSW
jgi:hypothetical protein